MKIYCFLLIVAIIIATLPCSTPSILPFPIGAWPSVWLPFVLSFLLGSHFVQQDTGEYVPKLTNLFGIHTSVGRTARRQAPPLMRSGISHPAYPHPTIGMQR
jgi:hypothetical protein